MIAVIQRVREATVATNGETIGRIGAGLLVLLGVAKGDDASDAEYVAEKLATLRCFADADGKMNRSIQEADGAVLLVSQFTLLGDLTGGRRPGFDAAAPPDAAQGLYEDVAGRLRGKNVLVETGRFGAHMQVTLVNDGPVTFILDTQAKKRNKEPT